MRVSVAMCTYNGETYIKEQLESICNQTRMVDEIVISDDHSTDKTLMICEDILKDKAIPYIIKINNPALGVIKNFQQCFEVCTGEVIFSCDQDDIWEKEKVEKIVDCFEKHTDVSMIATNATLIDGSSHEMNISLRDGIGFHVEDKKSDMLPDLLKTYCITGATMAFRKSFEAEYFYISNYWLHDGWLALMASLNNQLLYLDDKLTRYRLHGNNVCGIGFNDILQNGTITELKESKRKQLFKTVVKSPYYYEDLAQERMNMYAEVLTEYKNKHAESNVNLQELEKCIRFWERRSKIKNYSYRTCKMMIQEFVNDNAYEKYCESANFRKYDKYFWWVYHVIQRRKK